MCVCRIIIWLHILCSSVVKISAYGEGAAHDHNFVGSDETPLRNLQGDVAAQGEKMSTLTSRASSDRATVAAQAKMLEELLGRLEKQDSKFSELIAELNNKFLEQDRKNIELNKKITEQGRKITKQDNKIAELCEQDEKHAEDISIKNEEIAELNSKIAALREQAGDGGVKEAGVGPDGQPQSRRRATASTSDANLVKLRAEGKKLVIDGDVDIKGDIVVRGRSYGSLLGAAPTPLPTLSGAPTESPTPRPSTPPTESPTPIPSTPRPSGSPTQSPTSFTYGK